jgi:cobalt/nickel transport system permease protein
VSVGHERLYLSDLGPLHRFAPQCKLVGAILFTFAVVSTPREQIWAFALHASLLATVVVAAQVPIWFIVRRLTIELPFIAFAFLLPFFGEAPRVDVVGLHLSEPGLWAAWNIVVKGTLGVATTIVLAATTSVPHLLTGLERLRMPRLLVGVMSFMIRYGDVVSGEMRRMRIARESRGYNPRWIWQAKALSQSTGTLFIRSYERGERVYLAMEARGYNGSMPARESAASRFQWAICLLLPVLATAVSCAAWLSR